jgi:outer membrane protein OmpA-like peptidoglycan-associated protein
MSFNLLELARSYFTDDAIRRAATNFGESEMSLRKGVDAVLPLSALGMINKSEAGHAGAVLDLSKQAFSNGVLDTFGPSFGSRIDTPAAAAGFLGSIFGDRASSVTNHLFSFTGLKKGTISSLLGSILPLMLGLVGRHAVNNNLTAGGLSSLLSSMKSSVLSALPDGMNLQELLPAKEKEPVRHREFAHETARSYAGQMPEKKKSRAMPLLLGLAALLLLLWIVRGCNKKEEVVQTTTDTTVTTTPAVAPPPAVPARESVKVKLPDGVELDAYKGGIEDMLVVYLNSNEPVDKDKWFDFHDLNFKFGTAEIVPESRNEVANIEKILKAYPKVKIKIGGYTDKVGDEAANKKLSKERATAVMQDMKAAGVGGQVTDAEGYGSQFAKYPADAPEEDRIKDRRVSVSVREK